MTKFRTALVEKSSDVDTRLADFELTREQLLAVRDSAKAAADDASPLMPLNAPGTLSYIHGVGTMREVIIGGNWVIDRTLGIEAIYNSNLGLRLAFQNVDRSCDPIFPPMPRSAKGPGAEKLCSLPLFEHFGIALPGDRDRLPDRSKVENDEAVTYFIMVGEDGSIELSCPIIGDKKFLDFRERIFVWRPREDFEILDASESDPIDEFDVAVTLKEIL